MLTKLDGDARGGAALSVAGVTGRPVMFASTGEKLEDFELFHPDRMASRILDMGDVLTLIEQAERAFDAEQAEKMAAKFAADEDFTLDDFLEQMAALKNMGSLKKMLGMLPGMGELREQLENFDEREMDRVEAIIQSMTPQERQRPEHPQRVAPAAHRSRLRRPGQRRQPAPRAVRRGAEDDAPDAQGRRHAGPRRDAGDAGGGKKSKGRTAPPPRKGKAQVRQPGQARAAGAGGGAAGRVRARVRDAGRRVRPRRRRLAARAAASPADPADLSLPPGFEKFLGR